MIKKPNEIVQTDNIKIRMLIAGFPGIGKTTLGLSAPRPLLIDADFGAARVNPKHRKDTIQPDTYEELLEDLKPEILEEYETLVFDTGGALLELMKAYCIKQDPKNSKKDGALSLQGYGAVAKEFQRLMHMAYTQLKKHIVIIFHAKEEKDNDSTKLRILIEGQTKDTVWQSMDLGGFMEMQGSQRTIGFTNCEKYFAKGTYGIRGVMPVYELDENNKNTFLTQLFHQIQNNLQKETESFEKEKIAYETLMESFDFEHTEINVLLAQIKKAKHILTSETELIAKFKEKLKKEGYIYDKEKEKYVLDYSKLTQ